MGIVKLTLLHLPIWVLGNTSDTQYCNKLKIDSRCDEYIKASYSYLALVQLIQPGDVGCTCQKDISGRIKFNWPK